MEKKDHIKETKRIDHKQVSDMLCQLSDDCRRLAEKISEEGIPLSSKDKELIRFSYVPVINEITMEIKTGFITGEKEYVMRSLNALTDILHSFTE